MKTWAGNLRLRYALIRLQGRGIRYSLRDLTGLGRADVVLLRKLMRGPSGVLILVAVFYGFVLGLALAVSLLPPMLDLWGNIGYLYAIMVLITVVFLCLGGAMVSSEYVARRENPFYSYVRRCRSMIWAENWSAGSLDSRRRLAVIVRAFVEEAEHKRVRAEVVSLELEMLVDQKKLSKEDLARVGDLARAAALLPFRGEVDMKTLASSLVAAQTRSRARGWFRRVSAGLIGLAGLVTALIAPVTALRELIG